MENDEMNWLKAGVIFTILVILVWLFSGCCASQPPTNETRTDTVYLYQTYTDTLMLVQFDTVWSAGDERIIIKIDTLWKKVWYKFTLRDTIYRTDTVKVYRPPAVIEKTWFETIQIYLFPVCIGIIAMLVLVIYIRK